MRGVKYIGPVFDACYDEDTDVLTSTGWKSFRDISLDDEMATLSENGDLEYYLAERVIVKEWDGDMCHFYNHRAGVDLLVTPDHSMYVAPEIFRRPNRNGSFRFEKAIDILDKYRLFKKDCVNSSSGLPFIEVCGRRLKTEDWLEFLGYYLSEGSSTVTKSPNKHYVVQIRQVGEYLPVMSAAMRRITPNKINIRPDGRVIVNDKALALYLKSTFGDKYSKRIPREILDKCSKSQLLVLLHSLMLGDGHSSGGGGSSYTTASKQLRDDFTELLLKTGLSGSYTKRKAEGDTFSIYDRECVCRADNWVISVRWKQHTCAVDGAGWGNGGATKNRMVKYSGKVYCVTVPNHTLFVRRNGKSVWCGNSGYAEAARNYVLSIHKQGYPIQLMPISFEKTRPDLGADGEILTRLVNTNIQYDKVIVHSTPDLWQNFTQHDKGKYIIGYTVWETSKLHPSWAVACNRAEEVWVPCDWNMEVFRDSGVRSPLYKIPHAIDVPDLATVPEFNLDAISEDAFVFYSIFQWQERKNPYGLLSAYTAAFTGVDDVVLVLKTYKQDHAGDRAEIRNLIMDFRRFLRLEHYPKMFLVVENMSRPNMTALHKRGDAFVLLQRSEGWGLPHFEAASCGKPVITPAYGGQTEFLKDDNSYLLDYSLSPVGGMNWSPYYLGDQYWCEPNMKQAVETMQHVYHNREEARAKGLRARDYVSENFTWDKVGKMIVDRLTQIDEGRTDD